MVLGPCAVGTFVATRGSVRNAAGLWDLRRQLAIVTFDPCESFFDVANRRQILVDFRAVPLAERCQQTAGTVSDIIEHALSIAAKPLLDPGIGVALEAAVETFKHEPRIRLE